MGNEQKKLPAFTRQASILVGSMYIALGLEPIFVLLQLYRHKKVGLFRLMPESLQDGFSTIFKNHVVGEPSQKDELNERVAQHARLYGTLETQRLLATLALTIVSYVLFFILLMSFMKWLQRYSANAQLPDLGILARLHSYKLLFLAFYPGFIIQVFAEYSVRRSPPRPNFVAAMARLNLARRIAQFWPILFGMGLLVRWGVLRNLSA